MQQIIQFESVHYYTTITFNTHTYIYICSYIRKIFLYKSVFSLSVQIYDFLYII